jgi:hypothetical protein
MFSAKSNPLVVADEVDHSNNQATTTKNRQFLIDVPGNIDISPAVIFHYLGDKFADMSNDQNGVAPPNYLIRPKQTTVSLSNMVDSNDSRLMSSPLDDSASNSNSSSEVSFLAI